jgi:hypothetical protein
MPFFEAFMFVHRLFETYVLWLQERF